MCEKLDLLLFGVTGLVGRYALKHLQKLANNNGISWGVAGRDETKIRKILKELKDETGDKSITSIPIIQADMYDEASIQNMTSKTKILLNACGPLRATGEIVVKSCIETKTHYIDVSAEENFMGKILIGYEEKARKAGVFVINACGIDCLAYDLGVLYLQQKFPGTLNSVETYVRIKKDDPNVPGPLYNASTWRSAIDLFLHRAELKEIKSKLENQKVAPILGPELSSRKLPFKPDVEDGWAMPLTSTDRPTVLRTQQYLHEKNQTHPVQIQTYIILAVFWYFLGFILIGIIFASLVHFKFGRWILVKYAFLITGGIFGDGEPSKEMCENNWMRLTFVGKGWKNKLLKSNSKNSEKENYSMTLQLKTRNPAYGATALCLVVAGVVMSTESSKLPETKGVLTPGIAFGNTNIYDLLMKNGLTFEITNKSDI